jgi:hypothetical protein
VLGFLSTADVGRRIPPLAEDGAQSVVLEWKLWEWREREEERRLEAEGLGAEVEEELPLFLPTPLYRRGVGVWGRLSFSFPFSLFCRLLCYILRALYHSWDRPRRRAKGSLQRAVIARTADMYLFEQSIVSKIGAPCVRTTTHHRHDIHIHHRITLLLAAARNSQCQYNIYCTTTPMVFSLYNLTSGTICVGVY